MEYYYYNHMDKLHQAAYHAMLDGINRFEDEFLVPRMEASDLQEVFFLMRLDHPEIFWAVSFKYKYYRDSPNIIFVPEYIFEKSKIKEHQKAMENRVRKLAGQAQKMSEAEKEKYVHDFICDNVFYDKLKKPYSHEIIGPLGQGVGVCEGIAKSVKILCDALGIWCIIVICGNNPEKNIKYRHTWNIVKIGGKYYHLDATFDNSLRRGEQRSKTDDGQTKGRPDSGRQESRTKGRPDSGRQESRTKGIEQKGQFDGGQQKSRTKGIGQKGQSDGGQTKGKPVFGEIRYDYFNLDDKNIFRDHEPLIAPAPKCSDGDHFYYKEKKLSFTKIEDVYKRSLQAAKKGKTLTFHWRGGYLTREVLAQLLEQIRKAGEEKGKRAQVSLNWPQAVLRVSYSDQLEESVTMEEANEGEQQPE